MTDSKSNICVFCLESFVDGQSPVGVAVPCGHCFHEHCWQAYAAAKAPQQHGYHHNATLLKCPMCQGSVSTKLVRLFVDFESIAAQACGYDDDDDTDDDSSSVSSSDEGLQEDNTEDKESERSSNADEDPSELKQTAEADQEIIVIDEDPDEKTAVVDETKHHNEEVRKYKRMAKKFKKLYRRRDAESKQLVKEHKKLNVELEKTKENYQQEISELDRQTASDNLKMHQQGLEIQRLNEQSVNAEAKLKNLERKLSRIESDVQRTTEELEKSKMETKEARKSHILEAEELLKQHPVLVSKVKKLEAENSSLKSQLKNGCKMQLAKGKQKKLLRAVSELREQEEVFTRSYAFPQPSKKPPQPTGLEVLDSQSVSSRLSLCGQRKRPRPLQRSTLKHTKRA